KSTGSLSLRNTTHSFGSIWAGIALGGNSTLWGTKARGAGSVTALQSNAYHDGAVYRAISTDEVSSYTLANGEHEFRVAGVTTAGDTVSFTTAMGIVNDGGVIVGSPT
ncbi:MAG: hypothetical protein HOK52_13570, partial [Candidatus Marinimicrobia bacterium]|nr:hypothetical protein [Candidatus Neomarinimicrobiota bacterium]